MRGLRWVLLLLLVIGLATWALGRSPITAPAVADGSVLVLEIGGEYADVAAVSPIARLFGDERVPLAALLSLLRMAERDARIAAVVLNVRSLSLGWARADEIRDAIVSLKSAGKRSVAHLEVESFGGGMEYYVASGAQEVWVSPGTRTPLVGLAAEYLFLGGLWEKLGVVIDVERIGEYKSAAEIYAAREMSPPHREMVDAILDGISARFVHAVAESRGLSEDEVRATIDTAPVTPDELQAHHLVNGIAFADEVVKMQGERPVVKAGDYAKVDPESVGFVPVATLALIHGTGAVVTGEGSGRIGSAREELAAETVSKALRDAADDTSIAAILFRIDSPGGSALASDVVWHAMQQARAKKPVIVSMSDLAASGGYYVACGADAIVAEPNTLTGSIGVFVLRPMLAGLFEKAGIGYTGLQRGRHADLLLSGQPLSDGTRARLEAEVRGVYDLFVSRVAKGRNLTPERVNEIGRGRVWTGQQALEIGLVDALGGTRTAVAKAREKLGLATDADVALVPYPAPKPFAAQIQQALQGVALNAIESAVALPGLPPLAQRFVSWLRAMPAGVPVLLPAVVLDVR